MAPDAELTLRLDCTDGQVAAVRVESTRHALPPQLVCGRSPDDVARLIPQLFSICGNAQRAAAAGALEAAQRVDPGEDRLEQRRWSVTLEALQETLWRLLIDWPTAMDAPPQITAIKSVRNASQAAWGDRQAPASLLAVIDEVAIAHLYGEAAADWLQRDLDGLDRWIEDRATTLARLLHDLSTESPDLGRTDNALLRSPTLADLQSALLPYLQRSSDYALSPHWGGVPAETGAIARQQDHPLLAAWIARGGLTAAARFIARLIECARLIDALRTRGSAVDDATRQYALESGCGIGLAETARGLLLHYARLTDGRVTGYDIVAPTEWNFHPAGPINALRHRPATDEQRLRRDARIVVRSLDPCVASRVEIVHA